MKQLFIGIIITLIFHSCAYSSDVGKRHYDMDELNKRIERRIKRGMRYNHRKINQERPLKIKVLNNK